LTGHAEVIEITYEKKSIDLKNILELFFNTHDPTTLNRQGADVGSQYRSVIFCCNREQYKICEGYINNLNTMKTFYSSVVTELHLISQKEPGVTDSSSVKQIFWQAERMHQNYFNDNIDAPYCELVIKPKIEKRNRILKKL
jgi:methionine-S-sulfoxide reductase